jgi:hypothetical protein
MAITHDYTILCEMARQEIGGKFTIIGLFPNGIATPQIPFPLPVLTFFSALKADAPGAYKFTGTLAYLATGETLARAEGIIQTVVTGPVILPIPLANLQFKAFGSYTWSLEIQGQSDPFVTEFQLAHLQIPQIGGFPAGFRPS